MENQVSFNYSYSGADSFDFPPQEINITIPTIDLSIKEYYKTFKSFLLAIGFSEESILSSALDMVLDNDNSKDIMEKVGVMDIQEHYKEVLFLKAKISRLENPNNPQYTEEEISAMCYPN
jgi:hypothetical protein